MWFSFQFRAQLLKLVEGISSREWGLEAGAFHPVPVGQVSASKLQ
jgi:hypothetical protein